MIKYSYITTKGIGQMQTDDKLLKIISHETKDKIGDIEVVTPSIYTSLFSRFASEHNIKLSKEDTVTNKILDEKIDLFVSMQDQTSKNALSLSQHADKAITAIENKDEAILSEVLEETQKLREEIKSLKESIYKDELTNVYNRKWLHDNALDEDALGFKGSGTLAIIDLNYFKIINDTYGHTIGDKVLVFMANEFKKTQNNVVRYGGDEFLILFCNDVTREEASKTLNELRESILKKNMVARKHTFKVSFSFGVEEFKVADSLTEIIEKADEDMYKDKIEIKKRIPPLN